jgi:ubiquitin C-terminal hydrolase/tetratricopeptide (TPR) repeat protein
MDENRAIYILENLYQEAERVKQEGTALFKLEKYNDANNTYHRALNIVSGLISHLQKTHIDTLDFEWKAKTLQVSLICNISLALFRCKRFHEVVEVCDLLLLTTDDNDSTTLSYSNESILSKIRLGMAKLYFRRAVARESMQQYYSAKDDLITCLSILKSQHTQNDSDTISKEIGDTMSVLSRVEQCIQRTNNLGRMNENTRSFHATTTSTITTTTTCSSIVPPEPDQQREIILTLLGQQSKPRNSQSGILVGESYYVIDYEWWTKWCLHVNFTKQTKITSNVARTMELLKLNIPIEQKEYVHEADVDMELSENDTMSIDESTHSSACSVNEEFPRKGYGPQPSAINNEKLIIHHDSTDPRDVFLLQWRVNVLEHHPMDKNDEVDCKAIQISNLLKPHIVKGYHFEILPREVYVALRAWYGEVTSNTAICIRTERHKNFNNTSESIFVLKLHTPHSNVIRFLNSREYNPHSGRVGLSNLGNTCFMNSALQCLSHVTPLTRYFLEDVFKQHLNESNPLGSGGKLAKSYNLLIKEIWNSKKRATYSPRALKRSISIFAPRFAGSSQHDSQEFLAFLLDGLHEDLNRVKNPPYIEKDDVHNENNLAVAGAKAWDDYCKRNRSIVMDTFYGQFKSTCICPNCKRISVSFDVFNHISLEIPNESSSKQFISIILMDGNGSRPPRRYGLVLKNDATVNELKFALSKESGLPPTRLTVCGIYESNIYSIFDGNHLVCSINRNDVLAAYIMDPSNDSTLHFIASHTMNGGETKIAKSFPLLLSCKFHVTFSEIRKTIEKQLAYFIPSNCAFDVGLLETSGKPKCIFPTTSGSLSCILPQSCEELIFFLPEATSESFLFLSIDWKADIGNSLNFIECENHTSFDSGIKKFHERSKIGHHLTLDDCFENFTHSERLDEENRWYCSKCKDHVRAEKTMSLWRLPNVLVVHLKRFEFKHSLRREKLETFIEFPLEDLDMTKYCAADTKEDFVKSNILSSYDLFGVVNHYGRLGFGHYNAYARRWNEDGIESDWILFDDSSVRSGVTTEDIVSNSAYILFYRRRILV